MSPKVSIVILNWNGLNDTIDCLESLSKIDYENHEIIIVDNNSSGEDVKILKELFGNYIKKIIVNKENLGFSGGNNVGIKYALENNTDVVLLLNNDTIVEANFLSKLVKTSIAYPDVGVLTPLINYYTDKKTVWFAGGYISRIRSTGIPLGIGKPEHLFSKNKYCTFASGCCMYIKKEVLEKVGFLDENYFLYLEDTDFSWRVLASGFKILYESSSKIYHKVGSTMSKTNSMLNVYFNIRNRLFFAKKNLGIQYCFLAIVVVLISLTVGLIFGNRRNNMTRVTFFAINDFWQNKMRKGSFDKIISFM